MDRHHGQAIKPGPTEAVNVLKLGLVMFLVKRSQDDESNAGPWTLLRRVAFVTSTVRQHRSEKPLDVLQFQFLGFRAKIPPDPARRARHSPSSPIDH